MHRWYSHYISAIFRRLLHFKSKTEVPNVPASVRWFVWRSPTRFAQVTLTCNPVCFEKEFTSTANHQNLLLCECIRSMYISICIFIFTLLLYAGRLIRLHTRKSAVTSNKVSQRLNAYFKSTLSRTKNTNFFFGIEYSKSSPYKKHHHFERHWKIPYNVSIIILGLQCFPFFFDILNDVAGFINTCNHNFVIPGN